MIKNLFLTNSLSKKKEKFDPIISNSNQVNMYVCGVTPYDFAHLGHGRCYTVFDLLYRLLKFIGYNVNYTRNFTDIDDKLINRAQKELGDGLRYKEIADKYIAAYKEDMQNLNCLNPENQPCVTDFMPEMINFVQELIKKDAAYVVDGDVYFRVNKAQNYGKLSHQNIEQLVAGSRVDVAEKKENPLDFALWKKEKDHTFWQSPWGWGRPGWHLECSVLAKEHLGNHIDLHGGGLDLIFPHHENEVAQSEALFGEPFSKYWVHNAFVQINNEKMSKSLGNFFTLKDIFKLIDPMVLRYYFLTHHHAAPLDFTQEDLKSNEKAYTRLVNLFKDTPQKLFTVNEINNTVVAQQMTEALLDDLNVSAMIAAIFSNINLLKENAKESTAAKFILQNIVGLTLKELKEEKNITPEIQKLLNERETARINKDWQKADEIRDRLIKMGIEVKDQKK